MQPITRRCGPAAAVMLQFVLFLYAFFDGAGSSLIVRPANTVAIQGQPVNLTCRTNLTVDNIVWQFSNATGHPQRDVIYRQGLNPIMRDRNITVEGYDLRFESVKMSDAGTYTCQEVDKAAAAWITVLEAEPQCWNETITKESDTSVVILLRCNVTYNGSLARQHDTNRLVPRTNWTCDPGVQLLINNTTDDRVSQSQPTTRTLTSSALRPLGSSAAGACRFLLYFETVTTDDNIDRAHPVYRFEWTHELEPSYDACSCPKTVFVLVVFRLLILLIAAGLVAYFAWKRKLRVHDVCRPCVSLWHHLQQLWQPVKKIICPCVSTPNSSQRQPAEQNPLNINSAVPTQPSSITQPASYGQCKLIAESQSVKFTVS